MSATTNPFNRAAEVLKQAKSDIESIFTDPDLGAVKQSVSNSMDTHINRMNHLSGSAIESTEPAPHYPPITNFMGDDITPEKAIAVSDLHVPKSDKDAFLSRVDALYSSGHTIPEDQLVLRGVAKKAGMTNYKDADLTVQFIAELQTAINEKNVRDAEEAKQAAELSQQERVTDLSGQLSIAQEKEKAQVEVYGEASRELEGANTDAKRSKAQARVDKAAVKLEELRLERIAIENQLKAADPLNAIHPQQ